MLLMLAVVACYTICSLSDKYAVSKLKMNGSTLTFIMAAATAFFMLAYLPFDSRYFDGSLTAYLAILLMAASKFLEFQLAAVVLKEMSAFELKAWLGLTVFLSYGTDLILGSAALGAVTAWKFGLGKGNKNPFVVGLLNGFMPCGPLQTMQLYALGTGSFVMGALSMFAFSIGTVPLMLGFGYISSRLSKSLSNNIFKYSGVFIIILGLSMGQRGLALTGINIPILGGISQSSGELAPVVDGYQEVTITANRYGYQASSPIIKGDIPVRLTIKVEELTSCNNAMYFPQYDKYIDLSKGDVIAEINPNGQDISFTCWMGMIRGNLRVE